jgi:hypothetical protein
MNRVLRLATVAALTVTGLPAAAQDARPQVPFDTAARGRRDGLTAADTTPVRGYVVVGVLTGFVAGFVALPVGAHNDSRAAGALAFVPFVWTVAVAGRKGRAAPPPDLAARIGNQPAVYQDAFRAAYAQRLAQRRRRATIIGGVTSALVGAVAIVGLAFAALASAGT